MNLVVKSFLEKNIFSRVMPHRIKRNKVLFESNGPYDNGYALFQYSLKHRKDLDVYFVTPFSTRHLFPKEMRDRLLFYGADTSIIARIKYLYHIYTFSYVFSTYGFYGSDYSKAKRVFLCHGIGLKAAKKYVMETTPNFDRVVLPTYYVAEAFEKTYGMSQSQIDILPSPRKSLLRINDKQSSNFRDLIHSHNAEKIILVMTTIRRLNDGSSDENRILTIDLDLERLNERLILNNQILVFKLHHALDLADTSGFPKLSNVAFIKNSELLRIGLNPTSVMTLADALISDYSSSATDYLRLNRPMGFLIPDFSTYSQELNGDFLFDDPKELMPGSVFVNQDGLELFLNNLSSDDKKYKERRQEISVLLNGDYSDDSEPEKVILDFYLGRD